MLRPVFLPYVPLLTPFLDATAGGSLTFVLVLYFFGAIALSMVAAIKAMEAVEASAKRRLPLLDDDVAQASDEEPRPKHSPRPRCNRRTR